MGVTWKTARVFISSTFRDMHAERDHLVKVVFPELRERLVEGYVYDVKTSDPRRLHSDIQPFESLPENEKHLDDDMVAAIWRVLKKMGLVVVKNE